MCRFTFATVITALSALLVVPGAYAVPITFNVMGEVTSYFYDSSAFSIDPFGGTIAPGSAITGSYTFESTAPDTLPADPKFGRYEQFGYELNLSIGGNPLSVDGLLMLVTNGSFADAYWLQSNEILPSGLEEVAWIDLSGTNTGIFSDDSLPTTPPDVSLFDTNDFFYGLFTSSVPPDVSIIEIYGRIDSITKVTEPTSIALIGLGLAAFGLLKAGRPNA